MDFLEEKDDFQSESVPPAFIGEIGTYCDRNQILLELNFPSSINPL